MSLPVSLLFGHKRKTLDEVYFQDIRPGLYTRLDLKQQHGVRTGRSLAEHLDSAVQFTLTLSRLAQLEEPCRKILAAAAAVHDLNKLADDGRSVQKLARDPDFLKQSLKTAGVLKWLSSDSELEMVRRLIERHSGHHVSDGLSFLPEDPLIEKMACILRAADLIDIGLEEEKIFSKVSMELESVFQKPCRLFRVRLNEQRGYLSALLLESIEELLHRYELIPICHDANSTLFMGANWPEKNLNTELAVTLDKKLQGVFGGNLEAFIHVTKDGIKIQDDALNQDLEQIMMIVTAKLEEKRTKFKSDKIKADIQKWASKASEEGLQAAEEADLSPVQGAADFTVSECLKAAYLSYRRADLDVETSWRKIGQQIGLNEKQLEALQAFDGQYARPLFAATASQGLDAALESLKSSLQLRREQQSNSQSEAEESTHEWLDYICQTVSWPVALNYDWQSVLNIYIKAGKDKYCSLGATHGDVQDLSSSDFPKGTKVQVFSNRLAGGRSGDPKRKGSKLAILDYRLMNVGAALPKSDASGSPYYAHLFLPEASSPSLKAAFKAWILEQAQINPEGPIACDDKVLYKQLELHFKANKVVGAAFPRRTGFIASQVVFPLYWGKDSSDSLSLLKSLRLVLELAVHLNVPFVLGPNLEIEETRQCFGRVSGIPSNLQTLLMQGHYQTWSDARRCLQRLQSVGQIMDRICGKWDKRDDCLYELASVLSSPQPLAIYSALLRWFLRTHEQDTYSFIVQDISPLLTHILEEIKMPETSPLTTLLRQAAQLAADHHIRGKSFERTSLVDPIQHFLEAVRQQKPHHDLDFIFADLIQRYHNRLDRLRENGVGLTKLEQLKSYYGILRQLYEEVYQGRPERLMPDEKALSNAYLFFYHEANQKNRKHNQDTEEPNHD